MDCAKFWMGHTVHPLGYDKFYNDQEYVRKQYLIAEKYLNIISKPTEQERPDTQERITKLEADFEELRRRFETRG